MRWAFLPALLMAAGCETSSGNFGTVLKPVAVKTASPPSESTPAAASEPGGFDFEEDAGDSEDGDSDDSVEDLAAKMFGVEPGEPTEPPPALVAPAPAPGMLPGMPTMPPQASPTVGVPVPSLMPVPLGWSVRLVDVLESDPPMAYLQLPSGESTLVKAGDLVPEAGLVILAVGREAVQVAEVIPNGTNARVEARILSRLSP